MHTLRLLARLVKIEHTVFALPFAYAGMVLASQQPGVSVGVATVVWITVAMVGARTAAMAINRLVDARIDARNPRTAQRELPTGQVSRTSVAALCVASVALLVLATTQLAPITRVLWPIPVALFVVYPYTKRFTWLCHLVLGLSIGLAPLGAWLATGASGAHLAPYLVWLAIGCWIGGFDVLYATEDVDFDRANGIHAIPARFGITAATWITRALHVGTVVLLGWVGAALSLNPVFWIGLAVGAGLLAWENSLVRSDDLSRLDLAFFTINSWVGVVLGVSLAVGVL